MYCTVHAHPLTKSTLRLYGWFSALSLRSATMVFFPYERPRLTDLRRAASEETVSRVFTLLESTVYSSGLVAKEPLTTDTFN